MLGIAFVIICSTPQKLSCATVLHNLFFLLLYNTKPPPLHLMNAPHILYPLVCLT
jgi:hypothetical protein